MPILKSLLLVYAVSICTVAIVFLGSWLKTGRHGRQVASTAARPQLVASPSGAAARHRPAA
jgi:hypothetical protein